MSFWRVLWLRLTSHAHLLRQPVLLWFKVKRAGQRYAVAAKYRRKLAQGAYLPPMVRGGNGFRLSVLMPVYRVRQEYLEAAISSVRQQSFKDFEFVILNDASPDPHVPRLLRQMAQQDPRICLRERAFTGGISVASNELVTFSSGDFLAFVDHDDLLHPRALEAIAAAAQENPQVDWFFTDEDKLDLQGRHGQPFFKLPFSHHMLLCLNLVSHLRVLRRPFLERAGLHRLGFEGAQDWDLALRFAGAGARFAHVPGVLYHWRVSTGSMAAGSRAKGRANAAASQAISSHLATCLPQAESFVEPLLPGASLFRVWWRFFQPPPVSVLLPPGHPPPSLAWPVEMVPVENPGERTSWVRALERTQHPILLLPTPDLTREKLEKLVAFLHLPGTLAVAGRWVSRGRVRCSGWVAKDETQWRDPWAGLALGDPGYANLALFPQPRDLLPPLGWVAWREALLSTLDQAPAVPMPWLFSYALAQGEGEQIVTPQVVFRGRPHLQPPLPPLFGLLGQDEKTPSARQGTSSRARWGRLWPTWAEELGLFP
jgi:hypothetical protein